MISNRPLLFGLLLALLVLPGCQKKAPSNAGLCQNIAQGCDNFSDQDGDGVPDRMDNCIVDPNPAQENLDDDRFGDVCDDDRDGDGILNIPDNCENDPNPLQEDTDNDGEGDACDDDIDEDGWLNAEDNCPKVANPSQEDLDGDDVGDACDDDIDNDRRPNAQDEYPYCQDHNRVLDLTNPRGLGGQIGDGRSPLTANEFSEVPYSPCAIVGDVMMENVGAQDVDIFEETLELIGSLTVRHNETLQDIGWPKLKRVRGHTAKGLVGSIAIESNESFQRVMFEALELVTGNLGVSQNEGMAALVLDAVDEVGGTLNIRSNPHMTTVHINALKEVKSTVSILTNPLLQSFDAPYLERIGANLLLQNNGQVVEEPVAEDGEEPQEPQEGLTLVSMPLLREVGGHATCDGNDFLLEIIADSLTHVGGKLTVTDHARLRGVDVNQLTDVAGVEIKDNLLLEEIDLSSLYLVIGEDFIFRSNPNVLELSLAQLFRVDGNLRIQNNEALVDLYLDNLVTVGENLEIKGNAQVQALDVPVLREVKHVEVWINNSLELISAPSLSAIEEALHIWDNPYLHTVNLSGLTSFFIGDMHGNARLTALLLTSLTEIFNTFQMYDNGTDPEVEHFEIELTSFQHVHSLQIFDNPNVRAVHFPTYRDDREGNVHINGSGLREVSMPVLTHTGTLYFGGNLLGTIHLENLRTTDRFQITGANQIEQIVLTELVEVSGGIEVSENANLTAIVMNELRTIGPNPLDLYDSPRGAKHDGLMISDNSLLESISLQKLRTIGGYQDGRVTLEDGNIHEGLFTVLIGNNPNLVFDQNVFIEADLDAEEIGQRSRAASLRADALKPIRILGNNPVFLGNRIFNPDYLQEVHFRGAVALQ